MIYELDRISLLAKYEQPEIHRHYAKHFLISEIPFTAVIKGEKIVTRSVFIQSNVVHEIIYETEETLFVMLIDETSTLSDVVDKKYLEDRSYLSDIEELEIKMMPYLKNKDLEQADKTAVLEIMGGEKSDRQMDPAILKALQYVKGLDTIDEDCFSRMAEKACLSKSRFSHLFKENMHIDCRNFLLQKKFEKAFILMFVKGYSITDAAVGAGFSSSSHIATAFKNHFGISISKFVREQKISFIK